MGSHGHTRHRSYLKSGSRAIAVVATLLFSMSWSATQAQARSADGCSAQLNRVAAALISGRRVDPAQMKTLQSCLLSQPAAVANSLEQATQAGSTTSQSAEVAPTVGASFRTSFLGACLNFNSDGTISGGSGVLIVDSGGYLGTPGVFTVYSYNAHSDAGITAFGLTIGPFLVEVETPFGHPELIAAFAVGLQVPSCAA